MDLRQLRALLAVADHHSFSAAADALLTVQSNVSAHVARLETELKVTLIDRKGVRLTVEGQVVAERARRVEAELEAIVADIAALSDSVVGTVRLGIIGTSARWLAPRLLHAAGARFPALHLVAVEGTSTALETQLSAGALDLAVLTLPLPASELKTSVLFEEDLALVVESTHPLVEAGEIDLAELSGVPLLLPAAGTTYRDELEAAAKVVGAHLVAKAELDGLRLIAGLTFDGHGPAILPATGVPDYLADRWKAIPVRRLPRRRVGVAERRTGMLSAPARAMLDILREVVAASASDRRGIYPLVAPAPSAQPTPSARHSGSDEGDPSHEDE